MSDSRPSRPARDGRSVQLRGPHFPISATEPPAWVGRSGSISYDGPDAAESRRNFSLAEARGIVRDLFTPNPRIYWTDFLITILSGHLFCGLTREMPRMTGGDLYYQLPLQGLCFVLCCILYYRAAMFIHELSHLPEKKFRAFRIAWNLLAGIPFLTPSFTYYTHLDHHRRKSYGTHDDGEYVALARWKPIWILVFLSQAIWIPPLAILRFGLLTPLTWIVPGFRQWVHQRCSSLVVDPRYIRPLPSLADQWTIRLQEGACFAYLVTVCAIAWFGMHRLPWYFLLQAWTTGGVLVLMNAIRTLAAHRWASEGDEVTFVDQMLDSVNVPDNGVVSLVLNPVGLRFHATHHLFPSMPYHHLAEAHARLMAQLPADSPYRDTVEPSIGTAMRKLWHAAAANSQTTYPSSTRQQSSNASQHSIEMGAES